MKKIQITLPSFFLDIIENKVEHIITVGKKYNISITRVERSIRHAIEVSWNRGDWDLMEEIFGHSVDIDKAKPTNSEFIVTIADKLKLDTLKINS